MTSVVQSPAPKRARRGVTGVEGSRNPWSTVPGLGGVENTPGVNGTNPPRHKYPLGP